MRYFQPIDFKQKTFSEKEKIGYKIFKSLSEFEHIEAETVSEAIEKSGIEKPFKIIRANLLQKDLLLEDELKEMKVAISGNVDNVNDTENSISLSPEEEVENQQPKEADENTEKVDISA